VANLNNFENNSANLNDSLINPEKGWKRFENTNSNIKYVGAFVAGGEITYSTLPLSVAGETKVEFKFSGTKLRLIGAKSTNYSEELGCRIDGKEYIFTQKGQSKNKTVDLEVLNLENKIHEVEIYNIKVGSYGLVLDAVDVDEDGALIGDGATEVEPKEIYLNKNKLELVKKTEDNLVATITPANSKNKKVIWISSDENVVKVDENGKIIALNEGKAIIKAKVEGTDLVAICEVNVIPNEDIIKAESVTLNKKSIELLKGTVDKVEATILPNNSTNKKVIWTSSDLSIVSIDVDGACYITGQKEGKAIITAKIEGTDIIAKCEVTVVSKNGIQAEDIKVNKTSLNLNSGDSEKLIAKVLPENSTNTKLIWTSSDENIVKVDENGNVTAIKEGNAQITVRIDGTDIKDSCDVIVKSSDFENNKAILLLTLTNGAIKEYDVTMKEVNKFIKWYEDKTEGIAGVGPAVYSFYKKVNPYKTVKEYIKYDIIYLYEYREY
ncbi:Ig-like domain-containing protein, partial [Clostridium gasigenes]